MIILLRLIKKDAEEKIANVVELAEIANQYDTLEDFSATWLLTT